MYVSVAANMTFSQAASGRPNDPQVALTHCGNDNIQVVVACLN